MPSSSRPVLWVILLVLYAVGTFGFTWWHVATGARPDLPAPVQLLPLIIRLMALSWGAYLLLRLLSKQFAWEYLLLFPLLTLIGGFFLTMVLLFFRLPLAGPGTETPILFGSVYGLINLLILFSTGKKLLTTPS